MALYPTVPSNGDTMTDASGNTYLYSYPPGVWRRTAPETETVNTVAASSTAQTLDASLYNTHVITLTGNCTFTVTGVKTGSVIKLTLVLIQDATGSRLVTWPTTTKWVTAAPTLTTTAAGIDIYTLISYDGGTTWYGATYGKTFV